VLSETESLTRKSAEEKIVVEAPQDYGVLARKFPLISRAPYLPAFNLHLTKSRLNDAPRLCNMLRRNYSVAASQRKEVELFRAQGE
jgi:hypothetical protein